MPTFSTAIDLLMAARKREKGQSTAQSPTDPHRIRTESTQYCPRPRGHVTNYTKWPIAKSTKKLRDPEERGPLEMAIEESNFPKTNQTLSLYLPSLISQHRTQKNTVFVVHLRK